MCELDTTDGRIDFEEKIFLENQNFQKKKKNEYNIQRVTKYIGAERKVQSGQEKEDRNWLEISKKKNEIRREKKRRKKRRFICLYI